MAKFERGDEVVYEGDRPEHCGTAMKVLFVREDGTYVLQFGTTIHDSIYNVQEKHIGRA